MLAKNIQLNHCLEFGRGGGGGGLYHLALGDSANRPLP